MKSSKRLFVFVLIITLILGVIGTHQAYTQISVREVYMERDPVSRETDMAYEEKLEVHRSFLTVAQAQQNRQDEFFGQLYLYYDYLKMHDYATAANYLFAAKILAEEAENNAWLGLASYWHGVLENYLKNEDKALLHFRKAGNYYGVAGEYLCQAESRKAEASALMYLDSFALAEQYLFEVIPLFEKYGSIKNLTSTYANIGGLYLLMNQEERSIPYYNKAIDLHHESGDYQMESKARNNLAEIYRRMGKYESSLKGFQESIAFNKKQGYSSNLISNYLGLYFLYKDMEDYKSALEAIELHEMIKDSLIGVETQEKVVLLETKIEIAKTEAALQKTEADLTAARLTTTSAFFLAGILLLAIGAGIWRWRIQVRHTREQQVETRKQLLEITGILANKYKVISELEGQVAVLKSEKIDRNALTNPPESIYTKAILTDEDWNVFREGFEKTYPEYQFRLRKVFPELTPAEERLFLLLKLNLGRKEIADLLGLSVGSIKKSRTRLRKRLNLESGDSLEDFIRIF